MKTLIIVDVQNEFKEFIQFDLVSELMKYSKEFDNVYQIWDSHEATEPSHTFPKQVKTVEKLFGKNHFSDKVKEFTKQAEDSTEEGKLFKLSNGEGYLVRVDNNHDWFFINPAIYDMIDEIKNNEITLVGGANQECLEDVKVAIEAFGINVTMNNKYIYSAKTSDKESVKERKVLRFTAFINESVNKQINIDETWDYGSLESSIYYNTNSVKLWLHKYGEFDKTDEIVKDIKYPIGCLKNIKVAEEQRGKDNGNKILNYFIDRCIDSDVKEIILIADLDEQQIGKFDLVKWYESKGFKKINTINGNPVMKMVL